MKEFMLCNRWGMKLIQSNSIQSKRPAARLVCGSVIAGNLLVLLLLAVPFPARGQIFVTSENGFAGSGSLGEYNLDGTSVNASLIPEGGLYLPLGMALSGSDLFIAQGGGNNSLGEYTTSGATVNASLVTGLNTPVGIAVSGSDLFVVNNGSGTIGGYTTSGATVNASLVTGLNNPYSLAVLGSDLFVLNNGNGTIGEYTTSGATVNASLVTGLNNPSSLVLSGSDLFVASIGSGTIGEYTTSGATVNASLVTGLTEGAYGMAVSGSQLFVAQYGNSQLNAGSGSVYEYTLGATPGTVTSSNTSFITGLYEPHDIVAVPEPSVLGLLAVSLTALLARRRRDC